MAEPNLSKLPKWAQEHITGLERDLKHANARFGELGHVLAPLEHLTRGHISYGNWLQSEIEIPGDDHVTFHFGNGADIRGRFNDDHTELVLQGSDTFELHLQSSNTLGISLERDRVREKLLDARAAKRAQEIIDHPEKFDGSYGTKLVDGPH